MILNGKIETTKGKAKSIQGQIDKLITLAKKGKISARRKAFSYLGNDNKTVDFLFEKLVSQFGERKSGFTRLINIPKRKGDNAKLARIEWVDKVEIGEKEKSDKKNKKEEKVKDNKKEKGEKVKLRSKRK